MDCVDLLMCVTDDSKRNEMQQTSKGGVYKRKSDTLQSHRKLEKRKKVSTVVQYYKCNSGLSSIL